MKNINVTTFANNKPVPQHVVGITAAIIEESKSLSVGALNIEHHYQGMATTRYSFEGVPGDWFKMEKNSPPVAVSLSHITYPEETLAVTYEDRRRPNIVPTVGGAVTTYPTVTRHYQPKAYLGRNALNQSNSRVYETQVTRLDEANIHTDIFHFLNTGELPK